MSQKGRSDLTSAINDNVYDNNNKDILAAMVRDVLGDFKDSKFNLTDDELKGVTYQNIGDTKQTLEQYLNNLVGAIPFWGSTDYFDPASSSGDFESYGENGIISSVTYNDLGKSDCELTLNLTKSVSTRKLSISIHTESSNINFHNDLCAPVIRRVSSTVVKVGLREVHGHNQRIRLELLAFKVEV